MFGGKNDNRPNFEYHRRRVFKKIIYKMHQHEKCNQLV